MLAGVASGEAEGDGPEPRARVVGVCESAVAKEEPPRPGRPGKSGDSGKSTVITPKLKRSLQAGAAV